MKRIVLPALAALAACTPKGERSVHVVLDTDLAAGRVKLACRDSSSGTCHLLVTAGGAPVRLSAAKGASAEATGIGEGAQFCAGEAAPAEGCKLTPLRDGQQIFRMSGIRSG